jgi:hypothetical protein
VRILIRSPKMPAGLCAPATRVFIASTTEEETMAIRTRKSIDRARFPTSVGDSEIRSADE